ncbi:MAG: quinone-dependent dihydroorotate dehydrogenase [Myxococcota bacterium]
MNLLDASWPVVRRVLFGLDAETAHEWTLRLVASAPRVATALLPGAPSPALRRDVAGIPFAGPVGLAAGLDKDGRAIPVWGALGFGFVEVGTVTAHPQPGNPRPRLFRYPAERAIVNRMGFNNAGSAALADRLRRLRERGRWPTVPVGANVGKSKVTSLDDAPDDYATSVHRLRGLVDWFTVNVSSPNTPGLRDLQDADALRKLLPKVLEAAGGTPVFLKLAPDLGDDALDAAVALARTLGIGGFVATNTTIRRDGFDPGELGGLSGRPLWPIARPKIERVIDAAGGLPVIGVGGIESADQVRALLDRGCAAVQLYSAFVFDGPGLPARLHRALAQSASTDGARTG